MANFQRSSEQECSHTSYTEAGIWLTTMGNDPSLKQNQTGNRQFDRVCLNKMVNFEYCVLPQMRVCLDAGGPMRNSCTYQWAYVRAWCYWIHIPFQLFQHHNLCPLQQVLWDDCACSFLQQIRKAVVSLRDYYMVNQARALLRILMGVLDSHYCANPLPNQI